MRTDGCFNPVQQTLTDLLSGDIGLGYAIYRMAHRPVIMAGGHDQIDPFDLAIFLGPVMMDQCPTGGLQ